MLEELSDDERRQWRRFWLNVDEAQRQLTYIDPDVHDLANWTVLQPTKIRSDAGATFRRLPDGSFLVSGPNAKSDVFSLTADVKPTGIGAIRLDVLKDARLPNDGPGRHQSGNFHISEIVLELLDRRATDRMTAVPFARAWATHSWRTRPVHNAIDGKTETNWHIWGRLEVPHSAIFYLAEPLLAREATNFRIRIVHGDEIAGTLGRFRLSFQRVPLTDKLESQDPTK